MPTRRNDLYSIACWLFLVTSEELNDRSIFVVYGAAFAFKREVSSPTLLTIAISLLARLSVSNIGGEGDGKGKVRYGVHSSRHCWQCPELHRQPTYTGEQKRRGPFSGTALVANISPRHLAHGCCFSRVERVPYAYTLASCKSLPHLSHVHTGVRAR